jgi:hypothetical protein
MATRYGFGPLGFSGIVQVVWQFGTDRIDNPPGNFHYTLVNLTIFSQFPERL